MLSTQLISVRRICPKVYEYSAYVHYRDRGVLGSSQLSFGPGRRGLSGMRLGPTRHRVTYPPRSGASGALARLARRHGSKTRAIWRFKRSMIGPSAIGSATIGGTPGFTAWSGMAWPKRCRSSWGRNEQTGTRLEKFASHEAQTAIGLGRKKQPLCPA